MYQQPVRDNCRQEDERQRDGGSALPMPRRDPCKRQEQDIEKMHLGIGETPEDLPHDRSEGRDLHHRLVRDQRPAQNARRSEIIEHEDRRKAENGCEIGDEDPTCNGKGGGL